MSFETFYRDHAPGLRAHLRRQFPRQADLVDDAVQHACAKAVQSPRTIDDLPRFIARAATNYLIDGVRADRRFVAPRDEFDVGELPAPAAAAIDEAEYERTRECTERALAQVGEPARTLVLMKHVEGCDYRQIAEHLHLSPGSIGTTLLRARRRVRELAMRCLGRADSGALA